MIFPPSSWHSWKNINICRSVQREIHGFLYVKESVFGKSTLNHQSCLFNQFNPMDFEESWWLNPHFSGLNQLNPRFWVVSTFFVRGFVGKKHKKTVQPSSHPTVQIASGICDSDMRRAAWGDRFFHQIWGHDVTNVMVYGYLLATYG